jgi:hypothetical protein
MAKSRSCYESLRSFLTRRRRVTTKNNGIEEDGGDKYENHGRGRGCGCDCDCDCDHEIGREHGRWINGESNDERTRSCDNSASDFGDKCTRNHADVDVDDDDDVDVDDDDDRAVHYFNHASQAPLSAEVKKLGIELIRASPWNAPDNRHSAPYSQARVRSLFAALIDSDGDEDGDEGAKEFGNASTGSRIAVLPSTAFAITLAARNIMKQHRKKWEDCAVGGGRILVLQDQFDSAVYPWQQVCDESKGRVSLEIVGHPEEDFHHEPGSSASTSASKSSDNDDVGGPTGWTRAVLEKLKGSNHDETGEIIAACLPPLHWSNGTLLDLEVIGAVCRDRNIPLIVDATQGAFVFVSRPWCNGEGHGFFWFLSLKFLRLGCYCKATNCDH